MKRHKNYKVDSVLIVMITMTLVTLACGKTIYVDDDASGANDGTSWENAYSYLQEALADANSADKPVEVRVAQGIYKPNEGIVAVPEFDWRTLTFQLINGVSLKGGYAGVGSPDPNARDIEQYETILSGDLNGDDVDVNDPEDLLYEQTRAENSYHVATGSGTDETAVLEGFIVCGGGNGMYNDTGNSTLSQCTFSGNSESGMVNHNSDPNLTSCIFRRNCAYVGGGMYNNESNPALSNCRFIGNMAEVENWWVIDRPLGGDGGGIYNYNSNPILTNCVFIGNEADYLGGGICNENSDPTLADCTLAENHAYYAGGMRNYESNPILTNCTFSGNSAGEEAAGLDNERSSPNLTNCIFSGNYTRHGGGMFNFESSPTLTNCIFKGNSALIQAGGIDNLVSSPDFINCTFSGNSAGIYGGVMFNEESNLNMINCTFNGNSARLHGGGMCNEYTSKINLRNCTFAGNMAQSGNALAVNSLSYWSGSSTEVINCILWDGDNEISNKREAYLSIVHSNIRGWQSSIDDPTETMVWGEGNIDEDPLFANPGYWADVNDPNTAAEPNDPNAIWVDGDYHLKSQAGRWAPVSGSWVQDDVTSPCVDAGDPDSDYSAELWPHGERINMGAYGGTREASMSPEAEGMSLPHVAYFYDHDMTATDSFKSLLEMYGVSVASISVNNLEQVSLTDYDLVILGDDLEWAEALEDGHFVATVEDSGKPVVGLGNGGYDFFGKLGLSIGNPNGAHGSRDSISVIDPEYSLFSTPYPIDIPDDKVLQLYTETNSVGLYLWPEVPETVVVIGSEPNDAGYYPLAMEHNRYLLWGFTESPQKMTEVGKRLFINVVIWTANAGTTEASESP